MVQHEIWEVRLFSHLVWCENHWEKNWITISMLKYFLHLNNDRFKTTSQNNANVFRFWLCFVIEMILCKICINLWEKMHKNNVWVLTSGYFCFNKHRNLSCYDINFKFGTQSDRLLESKVIWLKCISVKDFNKRPIDF